MIVIDDNNSRILKMKEKLLEINAPNKEQILEDYKHIAIDLDKQVYSEILNEIDNNHNYDKKSLQEQLEFLTELEADYVSLDELQHRLQNTYCQYGNEKLELSNISSILIDNIRNRISYICGYLISVKNIDKNNLELDRLNSVLIDEDKKNNLLHERLSILENKLKENLLKVEGRVYDKHGNSVYTNVSKELNGQLLENENENKFDLKQLFNDNELLENQIDEANKLRNELDERLQVAKICYDNAQSINNKDIYESIRLESVKANYRLTLLTLIDLIAKEETDYDKVIDKRKKLIQLMDCRKKYLKELRIKYLYDPLERIGVREQLNDLDLIGNNQTAIKNIRSQINELSVKNEEMRANSLEALSNINSELELVQDDTKFIDITLENDILEEEVADKVTPLDNQVIKVENKNVDFMSDRVREKTKGVITRVNQMINELSSKEVIPELVIEDDSNTQEDTYPDMVSEVQEDIYADIWPSNEDTQDEEPIFKDEETQVFSDNQQMDSFDMFEDTQKTDEVVMDDLFSETEPFESVPLFSEKADDGIFESNNKQNQLIVDLSKNDKPNDIVNKIEATNKEEIDLPVEDENKAIQFDQFWPVKEELEEADAKVKKLVA